jgi:hypothetical protein
VRTLPLPEALKGAFYEKTAVPAFLRGSYQIGTRKSSISIRSWLEFQLTAVAAAGGGLSLDEVKAMRWEGMSKS